MSKSEHFARYLRVILGNAELTLKAEVAALAALIP
jgi:hypothetical protein